MVAPINVKFGTGEWTVRPLPLAKFHVYRGRNVGIQPPKLLKKFKFWPEICTSGATRLQYFYEILSICTRLVWSLSRDKHPSYKHFLAVGAFCHKLSIAPKLLNGSKKVRGAKMGWTSSITTPSMVGIVGRAPAVDKKV